MAVDFITITFGAIVLFLFYIVMTILVREGIHFIFRLQNNTYYHANEISIPITFFVLLQLILGDSFIINSVLGVISALTTFIIIKRTYSLGWSKASLVLLYVVFVICLIFSATALAVTI
jgi:hypothetical protein